MPFDLATASSESRIRLVEAIRRSITDGELGRDGPLPSERELAKSFKVGRNTLRLALNDLSQEGLIQKTGPRVRTVRRPEVSDAGEWMRRAVVVLAPPIASDQNLQTRTNWLRYVMLGTVESIRSAGLHAISLSVGELQNSDASRLARSKPMGVLVPDLLPGSAVIADAVRAFSAAGVPVVVYGGNGDLGPVDRVKSDHEMGSYQLTRWMIAQGRRRIAQCWPKPWSTYWFEARQRGYERAMREGGLEPLPVIEFPYIQSPALEQERFNYNAKQVAGFLFGSVHGMDRDGAQPVDGLLMGTDRDAVYASAALRLLGREPNRDVLIAGYDDYVDRIEEKQWEPLGPAATVNKQNETMGELMVQMLRERAEGSIDPAPRTRVAPPRLVVRTDAIPPQGPTLAAV
jgi:DNA-binding LacI/PurR family transcriptional regulator